MHSKTLIFYRAIGKSVEEAARYVLAFWNAVDLRYRLLEEPIIRLNIAGIIISLVIAKKIPSQYFAFD